MTFQVCVVDNASADGSAAMVKAEFPEHLVIEIGEGGYAAGNNLGLRALGFGPAAEARSGSAPLCAAAQPGHRAARDGASRHGDYMDAHPALRGGRPKAGVARRPAWTWRAGAAWASMPLSTGCWV